MCEKLDDWSNFEFDQRTAMTKKTTTTTVAAAAMTQYPILYKTPNFSKKKKSKYFISVLRTVSNKKPTTNEYVSNVAVKSTNEPLLFSSLSLALLHRLPFVYETVIGIAMISIVLFLFLSDCCRCCCTAIE